MLTFPNIFEKICKLKIPEFSEGLAEKFGGLTCYEMLWFLGLKTVEKCQGCRRDLKSPTDAK